MRVTSCLALVVIAAFAATAVFAEDEVTDVKILGADTFADAIEAADITLVEFFAPWCGHCKALAPEYATAATELKSSPAVALASVDCTEHRDLCSKYDVKGFPTLKVFRKGVEKPADYDGPRKADGIVSYMKKQSLPAITKVATKAELDAIAAEENVVLVHFGAASEGFTGVASALRNDLRFVEADASIAGDFSSKDGAIVFLRQFDEPQVAYDGDASDADAIKAFIQKASFPLVGEIGPENYSKYVDRGLPMLWFFLEDSAKEETLPQAKEAAKLYGDKFSFVTLDGVKWAEHAKSFGLKGETPGIVLEDRDGGFNYVFGEGKTVDAAELIAFCQKGVEGTLEASVKSEEEPADNNGPVIVIVGTNYEKIVLDESKDVMLEFYAPWCGHCKSLTPKYEKLGEAFANNANVVIAKIDATANDTPNKIEGFPTIKFYKSNDKKNPVTYDGGRDEVAMEAFIRENATVEMVEAAAPAAGHEEL